MIKILKKLINQSLNYNQFFLFFTIFYIYRTFLCAAEIIKFSLLVFISFVINYYAFIFKTFSYH